MQEAYRHAQQCVAMYMQVCKYNQGQRGGEDRLIFTTTEHTCHTVQDNLYTVDKYPAKLYVSIFLSHSTHSLQTANLCTLQTLHRWKQSYHQVFWCITQLTYMIVQNISPSVGCEMSDHFQRGAGHKLNSNSCDDRNYTIQEQDGEAIHLCSSLEHEL